MPESLPDESTGATRTVRSQSSASAGSAVVLTRRQLIVDLCLVLALVAGSAMVGWHFGKGSSDDIVLVEASFEADENLPVIDGATQAASGQADPETIGRLKAEMLRLRVLFQRLAEVAEIDHDGEFDVDFEIDAKTGNGEPLSRLDPASAEALALLSARLDPMIDQVSRMQRIFLDRRREYDRRLSGRPLADGDVSSGFGNRKDPLSGKSVMHRGLDFVGEVGEPILAIADGVVTWSGRNGGYGLLVELEHADGFRTRYAHNDATLVELGSRVRKGEAIATLGSSGRSTGPHLHLEVRHRGKATDPRFFVR